MPNIIHRNAVRAILLTPAAEILLMRIRLEDRPPFWITPGGGREGDEDSRTTLVRELSEEVGLQTMEVGPRLWLRRHTFSVGPKRYCQTEEFYAVHVDRFDPVISDAVEARVLDSFRWWALTDLRTLSESVAPASLVEIVETYLRDGPPTGPLTIEVTED